MRKTILSICTAIYTIAICAAENYTEYVNPLMGTESSFELSAGNTYPAIARPWGMNFWTPQTGKMGDGWQYTYDAHQIRGFKQTHQPSPWINDYGQFAIMPIAGELKFNEDARASWFSHKGETAKPHYYSVYLADHDIFAELTPTDRAAAFRFTYPDGMSYLIIDAFDKNSSITIADDGRTITGISTRNSGGVPDNFANYFVVKLDRPVSYIATFGKRAEADTLALHQGKHSFSGFHAGAIVGFRTVKGEKVNVQVASSFISAEQASLNLRELGGKDFESLVDEGKAAWNDILGRIDIGDTDNIDNKRTFYSCLYRSTLFPRKLYEIDNTGAIVHYSPYNGKVQAGYMYTDTGVWDTFRCLFPLLNLMYPSVSREMQEGFLNAYRESGFFPEWCSPGHRGCMIGNNSASVLADAWLKGIRVADAETLWKGLVHGTENVHPEVSSTGRLGYDYYNRLGYVPYDVKINENAARTLEYAYDDWCIYQLGKSLGKPAKEIDIFAKRAMNYRNIFDKEHCLMRGRNADGSFAAPFSPLKWGDAFTEGNSWHYTWSVFHDVAGLKKLMGGNDKFVTMLDSVFAVPPLYDDSYYGFPIHEIREMTVMNMGNYAHGNQPIQHMIYLYNWTEQPWKAQYRVRDVMNRMYTPTPDGYCGDEDNGQTSAWYVFSALGFYPVTPGTDQYALGSPLFKQATLTFENGKKLTIEAADNSCCTPYVESLSVNNKVYDRNYITHKVLTEGGKLDFKMSGTPNQKRGTTKSAFPYSFSDDKR